MSRLCIKMGRGSITMIEGIRIVADRPVTLHLLDHAAFVHGKQYLAPAEAKTDAQRFYVATQTSYAGRCYDPQSRRTERAAAHEVVRLMASTMNTPYARMVVEALDAGNGYRALRIARGIVRAEAAGRAGEAPDIDDGVFPERCDGEADSPVALA